VKLDEILNQTFSNVNNAPDTDYNFMSNAGFIEYLDKNYPAIKQFVTEELQEIKFMTNGIAAINVDMETGKPILHINPKAALFILNECPKICEISDCYDAFACVLWHESLHYIFRHFRMPFEGFEPRMMNIAMDMIIDNHIHASVPGWRNWEKYIDAVNKQSPQKHLPQISMQPGEKNSIMEYGDKRLYFHLMETAIKIPDIRFDKHEWGDEEVKQDAPNGNTAPGKGKKPVHVDTSGEKGKVGEEGKGEGKGQGEKGKDGKEKGIWGKILDKLFKKARERKEADKDNPFAGTGTGDDKLVIEVKESINYDVMEILKKYINHISRDSKKNTWKKVSRKLMGKRPGHVYKLKPGEVFLAFDTSYSMNFFNKEYLPELLSGMFGAFKQIARIYGSPAALFAASIDTQIKAPVEINKVEEFNKILVSGGGGTDYRPVFDKIIMNWKEFAKSSKITPDLVIFVTDFGVDLSYLREKKYGLLSNKLVWLTTTDAYEKPPLGIVRRAMPKHKLP